MARRLHKTLIDYLVIAVSPALIITLIGSLVFFLLEVFYRGGHEGRLHYIFGLFVFAAVLVGRIAIEEGKERAYLFAVPLAIVTYLALGKYVQFQGGPWSNLSAIINVVLIGLILWCANKLTWDCTLIDEGQRDSGEGLLESAGLDRPKTVSPEDEDEDQPEGTTSRGGPEPSWWQRFVEHQRRPHAPGVWVVYFSLAALPLFGIGQLMIPAENEPGRQYAFNLLFVYVASGMGLLLSTSFLGLRRYLRQRRIEMPAAMANLWLLLGGLLIVALLVLVDFLPRPSADYSVSQLPFTIGTPVHEPSRVGVGKDGVEDKDRDSNTLGGDARPDSQGRPQQRPDGKPSNDPSQSGDSDEGSGSEQDDSAKKGSGDADSPQEGAEQPPSDESQDSADQPRENGSRRDDAPDTTDSQEPSQKDSPEGSDDEDNANPPDDSSTTRKPLLDHADRQPLSAEPDRRFGSMSWLPTLLKWAFWGVLVLLGLYWLWRCRVQVLAALRDFVQGWRAFWQGLFGGKRARAEATEAAEGDHKPPQRSFADFADPFASGMAERLAPDELVRYSFEALEAWAREQDCARNPDQTPHEFARDIGEHATKLSRHSHRLADLYCRVAYAPGTLPPEATEPLRQLWSSLR